MAYGRKCPICGAMVDNVEFDYLHGMCIECAVEQEQKEIRSTEVAKIMNSECEQMRLEDLCVLN